MPSSMDFPHTSSGSQALLSGALSVQSFSRLTQKPRVGFPRQRAPASIPRDCLISVNYGVLRTSGCIHRCNLAPMPFIVSYPRLQVQRVCIHVRVVLACSPSSSHSHSFEYALLVHMQAPLRCTLYTCARCEQAEETGAQGRSSRAQVAGHRAWE